MEKVLGISPLDKTRVEKANQNSCINISIEKTTITNSSIVFSLQQRKIGVPFCLPRAFFPLHVVVCHFQFIRSSNAGVSSNMPLQKEIIEFSDWWALQQVSKSSAVPILDLRSFEDHEKRCLRSPNSREHSQIELVVVSIPISVVEKRAFELPARHVEFSILVSESDLNRADSFLSGSNRKRPNPWKVAHVLLDTEAFWRTAEDLGMMDIKKDQEAHRHDTKRQRTELGESILNPGKSTNTSRILKFPMTRLWQPDPMIETILFPFLAKADDINQKDTSGATPRHVWDLAAGAGRDVAFLAEELLAAEKPHHVFAIDHRYNEKETKIVNDFWDRRGIRNHTTSIKLDLSRWETLEHAMKTGLDNNQVAAMFCVRFWKPELVKAIAQSSSIYSGVLFGISHFCKPSVGAPWNFEHPKEKTVLERNQLRDMFQEGWDILHNEIALDSDHGRTMIHFVARRN